MSKPSKKLLVLVAQWLAGAILAKLALDDPAHRDIYEWLMALVLGSGGTYHIGQGMVDAAKEKAAPAQLNINAPAQGGTP